jgi:redox-sensitive bicupin YhaK (pirin superfamily)
MTQPVDSVIIPPSRDLGDGFTVRRALPSPKRRMVGPFIFLDQMGPVAFADDQALDVRPHPHIGLATVTYLLEGEIMHRDSLGSLQAIRPGEVNWMTAGQGIVHSERTPDAQRGKGGALFGLQTWLALPIQHEETAPSFTHYRADQIPVISDQGATLTLIAGTSDGLTSPVQTFSDMVYADLILTPGARYAFRAEHIERAVYVVSGDLRVEGQEGGFGAAQLVVLKPGAEVVLSSDQGARLMLVGGEPFAEKRYVDWNFVSSRPDRIAQARQDWREDRFPRVPGESEFIPLPPAVPGAKLA